MLNIDYLYHTDKNQLITMVLNECEKCNFNDSCGWKTEINCSRKWLTSEYQGDDVQNILFDWCVFEKGKIAVNCKTKESMIDFLSFISKRGKDTPERIIFAAECFDTFNEDTCYIISPDRGYSLDCCHLEYCNHRNLSVFEWDSRRNGS